MTALIAVRAFLGRVPIGVWIGLAIAAALAILRLHYIHLGRAEELAKVAAATALAAATAARLAAKRQATTSAADEAGTARKGTVTAVEAQTIQAEEVKHAGKPDPVVLDAGSVSDVEAELARIAATAAPRP